MTARKPATARGAFADPDRPLLRLLNRAHGEPVLAMCGQPGDHDPAHAAAGRLPVRFHRFSNVRLYWREFPGGDWRDGWEQRFVALVVLTNEGLPFVDQRAAWAIAAFHDGGKPILWGEAVQQGLGVKWHPAFRLARTEERRHVGELPPDLAAWFNTDRDTVIARREDIFRLVAEPA